jgi:hypothetical protein
MATTGSLNPNSDITAWAASAAATMWQALDANFGTYIYTGSVGYAEVGLQDPSLDPGGAVQYVSFSAGDNSDGGTTRHLELWNGGTQVATGSSTALSHTFSVPLADPTDLRLRFVADVVPVGQFVRFYAASGSWTAASDTTAPAAPTGLTASPGWTTVQLNWTANGEADIAGYKVYRKIGSGSWSGSPVSTGSATGFLDTGLTIGETYSYRITAYDNAANESAVSSIVVAVTAPPLAPTGLTVTPGSSRLRVRWNASTIDSYRLYRKTGTDDWDEDPIYEGPLRDVTDDGLTPGTVYAYRVTVFDDSGNETSPSLVVSGVPTVNLSVDSYADGDVTIDLAVSTRWIRLADPGEKAQMHRVIPTFRWEGEDCPLQFALTDHDGSYVVPWTTLEAPTDEGDIHRPVIESFVEVDEVQAHYRVPAESAVAFAQLEIYDTIIEYQEARQRQP